MSTEPAEQLRRAAWRLRHGQSDLVAPALVGPLADWLDGEALTGRWRCDGHTHPNPDYPATDCYSQAALAAARAILEETEFAAFAGEIDKTLFRHLVPDEIRLNPATGDLAVFLPDDDQAERPWLVAAGRPFWRSAEDVAGWPVVGHTGQQRRADTMDY